MKDEELPPEEKVRIFVAFEGKESAMKAVVDLNNRYFAGRTVSASFYSELFFSQQIYTN
jgi:splicing factor 45